MDELMNEWTKIVTRNLGLESGPITVGEILVSH